jgi:sulfatase maturation enzyme AslB (radical SAM superfamily)
MRTNISEVELELVTNCSIKMNEETAEILNQFKHIRLSGSFDGLPELSEYQRVESNFQKSFINFLEYGDLLHNRRMTIHQTFTVINANFIDESLEYYKPYCDTQSWSYDTDGYLSFMHAPDWYEEWILERVTNQKFRNIIKQKKYDHVSWHRVLHSLRILDTYYTTSLEKVNPELSEILRIKTKKYIDAHEKPATRDCMYCDMIDEM